MFETHGNHAQSNAGGMTGKMGMRPIKTASEFVVIEVRGLHPGTEQNIQRLVFEKLRRQRQRPIGKTQPIENHAGNSFSGTDIFLLIFWYARVNHFDDFQILDNAGNNTQVVNTFDFNSFQCLVFGPLLLLIMIV